MPTEIRETPTLPNGNIDFAAIHPDPETAREVVISTLVGQLAEAHAAMCRALDFRTASPEGLSIKADVREALTRTGFRGDPGLRPQF
jgi:hypothetical protein